MAGDDEQRSALQAELLAAGLPGAVARRVAFDVAERGLRLVPGTDAQRSRLGGPGLLPPGEPWPRADGDRPLSFLAGLDLAEAPDAAPLPSAGWLLFFADLGDDDGGGLIEPTVCGPGAKARVLFVAAGAEPAAVQPPPGLEDVLRERRVAFVPQLTLPDGYESAREIGLTDEAAETYDEVAGRLRLGPDAEADVDEDLDDDGEDAGWETLVALREQVGDDARLGELLTEWPEDRSGEPPGLDHWVLGAVTGVQGHPAEADTVLLLHVSNDWDLQFEFLDGGAIQFRIPRDALAARDWARVVAEPGSA